MFIVHNMINVSHTGNPEMKQIGLLLRIKKNYMLILTNMVYVSYTTKAEMKQIRVRNYDKEVFI